jgi:hypothetical protein
VKIKRKVKKMVKENKEEKDSLFNDFKIKSQAAMEYLMTYGWAILIIALTLAVLYSLGIMNPKNFIPRAPPGSCFVFRPNGPGTTDFVSLQGTCGYLPMYVGSFNGVNAYISLPALFPNSGVCNLTLVAWSYDIGMNSSGARGGVVGGWSNGWANIEYNDASLRFELRNSSTGNAVFISSNYKNRWLFTALVLNNGYPKGYINGNNVWNSVYVGCIGLTNWKIGSWDRYFNGSITNVQIYNTALTPQEIQYLYQEGLGGGPIRLGSLVAWYPLNGDAKDYSGNNNHGTIYGGVTFVQNYNPP